MRQVLRRRVREALGPAVLNMVAVRLGRQQPWIHDYTYPDPGVAGRPPDFIGIGAQKAGTSWWFAQLHAHPDVDVSSTPHKELHFWSKAWARPVTPEALAAYHRQFTAPPDVLTGEWTPNYLTEPWVAPLLAEHAPQARLLVVLRDPVDRFASGVSHTLQRGGRDIVRVVETALQRSMYGQQLRWLFAHVGRDRVLVQQYERLRAQPEAELERLQRFLGLRPLPPQRDPQRRLNRTRGPKYDPPPAVEAELRRRLREDREVLVGLDLDLDLERWQAP